MRKFKLIKEYPGSPKLGTVLTPKVDKGNDNTNNFYWEGSWFNPNEFTEYWEEVIEPTFQIISFTATNVWKGKTANLLPNGHYSINPDAKCGWTLREMLEVGNCVKNGELQIHSVKRLSDGEIFTVGDRAKTITSKGSHDIRQFIIRQKCTGRNYDGIDAMWINWEENCGGNWLDSTEKVIEKDFEIMTFDYKGDLYKKNEQGYATETSFTHSLESHLEDGVSKVHAVKRLSDGEIFTVGDKFKANIGGSDVVRTIKSIRVDGNIIKIYQENGDLSNRKGSGIFHQIKKVKQPILTTEDGVPVYSYNSVQHWVINGNYEYALELCRSYVDLVRDSPETYKLFSTEAAAREYVRKNTPLFTTEDGVDIFYDNPVWWVMDNNLINNTSNWNEGNNCYESNRYFSTRAAAENYIVENKYTLSIKDFWEFASWGGSSVAKSKRLKRLVKERIGM
jgi:hypothetical protein